MTLHDIGTASLVWRSVDLDWANPAVAHQAALLQPLCAQAQLEGGRAIAANAAEGRSLVASAPGFRCGHEGFFPWAELDGSPQRRRHRDKVVWAVARSGLGNGRVSTKAVSMAQRDTDLGLTPRGYGLLPLRG